MFFSDPTIDFLIRGIVLAVVGLLWVLGLVRLVGLRSFSKMTNVDFVMTIAIGSLLAGAAQATTWSAFGQTLAAMSALFAAQYGLSRFRITSDTAEDTLQNQPALLMRDGEMIDAALRRHRVTRSDLIAKLREANVLDLADVRAVVLETTGDISVLHGTEMPAETLLQDVRAP